MKKRRSRVEYYLGCAAVNAKQSTCLRRQYGCVIVKDDEIIASGYNGSVRGKPNCCDEGVCWREAHNIPHGECYEKCVAVHAEQNAIIQASRKDMIGSTLYLVGFEGDERLKDATPCVICRRFIEQAGIVKVVNDHGETIID